MGNPQPNFLVMLRKRFRDYNKPPYWGEGIVRSAGKLAVNINDGDKSIHR